MRPAFDGGIVGQGEVDIGTLQVFEQMRIIDRQGCLTGQGIEEIEPFLVWLERVYGGRSPARP